jgi:hypothetical protein
MMQSLGGKVCGVLVLFLCWTQVRSGPVNAAEVFGLVSDHPLQAGINPVKVLAVFVNDPAEMAQPVAIVRKVVRDVARREALTDWHVARLGEPLSSGDRVKAGENSSALIKFRDNSFVRVCERSDLRIHETPGEASLSTSVDLENGAVGFHITKQRAATEFRFTSPTSVASIRGTGGRFVSRCMSDTLTLFDGMVVFTNVASGVSVEVRTGCTGISNPDGMISVRPATPDELRTAGTAGREAGETFQVVSRERRAIGSEDSGRHVRDSEYTPTQKGYVRCSTQSLLFSSSCGS